MDHAEKLIREMLALNMFEIEGGCIEPVNPRLWKWRDRAGDKKFQQLRRRAIRMCDAEAKETFRKVRARLEQRLAEYVELPATFQTVALIASALIHARDEFRAIASEDAFDEYDALRERVKSWRMEALDFALRKPKTQAWAEFLFEAGAWETGAEFEEELDELAPPLPEPPPMLALA
jgi:hypothetical protein